ncbi:unnamed protein product [Heligmosomoides polygyrus]|uniref:OTCace domain-containing protein n=1 Tax=Heligmosomoides polygyrus TaxID=6339 RepID=A0A183FQS5_HELPZ|nr:unnamed protein product [Heligmosomoides polygyrus]
MRSIASPDSDEHSEQLAKHNCVLIHTFPSPLQRTAEAAIPCPIHRDQSRRTDFESDDTTLSSASVPGFT